MIDSTPLGLPQTARARRLCFSVALLLLSTHAWSASPSLKPFLEANCIDCHDSETHKGGLNFDELAYQPTQRGNALTWEHVFDRVSKGEMPPAKKAQPKPEERASFLAEMSKELRAASLARQATEGRGPVRRMTRAEYEATVNDLLHIHTDLRSLFPEDAVTSGFDKVGEGLGQAPIPPGKETSPALVMLP